MPLNELLPLMVYERPGNRYSLVRGPVRKLTGATSIVAHWSPSERGYLVRTDRLGDLLAIADVQGNWNVRVRRIEQVTA